MIYKSLTFISCIAFAAASYAAQGSDGDVRIVIKKTEGVTESLSQNPLFQDIRATSDPLIKTLKVKPEEMEAMLALLRMDRTVERVEVDGITSNPYFIEDQEELAASSSLYDGVTPNDKDFTYQTAWMAGSKDRSGYMDLLEGSRLSRENKTLRIGVIDTGFRLSDDIQWSEGYNFASRLNEEPGPEFLEDYYSKDCTSSHGSAVAHVIGATTDNGVGIAGGVSAKIHPVRALSCDNGYLLDLAKSIRWLAKDPSLGATPLIPEPVDLINASMGSHHGYCPSYLQNAINYAYNKGIAIIVSAGNASIDVSEYTPAGCRNVFTVGSVNLFGRQSSFTNFGNRVDVSGLGEAVRSYGRNFYRSWSGTSFSAPNVTAVAAQALQTSPDLSPDELFNYLRKNTIPYQDGYISEPLGTGVVNAKLVLNSVNKDAGLDRPLLKPALSYPERGNQEAYNAAVYIDNGGNLIKPCNIFEVDSERTPAPENTLFSKRTLFKVGQGENLDVRSAVIVESTTQSKFIEHNLNPEKYDYGFTFCNEDASECLSDRIIPLNDDAINPELRCKPQMDI